MNEENKNIINGGEAFFHPSSEGLGYEIFRCFKTFSKNIAQYDAQTGEAELYENLKIRCVRMALAFQKRGITPEDIVCSCAPSGVNACVPFFASLLSGCKFSAFEPYQERKTLTYLLNYLKPKIIFITTDLIESIEELLSEVNLSCEIVLCDKVNHPKYLPIQDFWTPIEGEEVFKPVKPKNIEDAAMILLSSGTTSVSKGICLNHKAVLMQSVIVYHGWNIGSTISLSNYSNWKSNDDYIILSSSPFYWISGTAVCIMACLTGSTRVVMSHYDPIEFCKNIEKYKANFVLLQPVQANEVYTCGQWERVNTKSVHTCITGGTTVTELTMKRLREIFPTANTFQAYGQTEMAGMSFGFDLNDIEDVELMKNNPLSCGKPLRGSKYKVVDLETGEFLGPGKIGELRIKSEYQFKGYYNLQFSDTFDDDGWLKTGDLVYYDNNYCFFVQDRIKDLIRYQMTDISPVSIEEKLVLHPAVKECFVFGREDSLYGEVPVAVIVLESYEKVTENEICDFISSRLPDQYRLRGGVKFVKELIKTPTGKIKRLEMKKLILQNKI